MQLVSVHSLVMPSLNPRTIMRNCRRRSILAHAALYLCMIVSGWSQISKSDRDLAQRMLRDVASDVEKSYYDSHLHGIDWPARVRQAKENVDRADSMDSAVSEIAALLDSLNDSHTRFFPPPRAYSHDYGFSMRMIGEHCNVTRVKPGSDAEKKGLKRGDTVLAVNEIRVSRKTLQSNRIYLRRASPSIWSSADTGR